MLLAGLAVAAAGTLAFAGGQAKAEPFSMDFTNGQLNLGFAFKEQEILPAQQTLGPNTLPNLWEARATASGPDGTGTAPNGPTSFKPAGCITEFTLGLYAALQLDESGNPIPPPAGLVQDPRPSGAPFGGLLVQPLANNGAEEPEGGRNLAAGAIVPAGQTIGGIEGPYPATDIKWIPLSIAALPPTSAPIPPGVRTIPNPSYPCTTANPADATVSGEVDAEGNITIEANDFQFPIMIAPNPLDQSPVPFTVAATGPVTGVAGADGALDLEGPIEVRVLTGLQSNPLGSYCALPLPARQPDGSGALPFKLTTGYSLPVAVGFNGTPFESLSGPGALTGTWNITQPATSVGGADCGTVSSVTTGLGGLWLGVDVDEPAPFPTCEELGKVGTFPNCEDPKATIGKVTISGPSKVKRGKLATWKVRVPSTGNTALTGVRLTASGRGVKVNTPMGEIAAGASKTEVIKAKLRKTGKLTITAKVTTANAGSKSVKKTVTVTK